MDDEYNIDIIQISFKCKGLTTILFLCSLQFFYLLICNYFNCITQTTFELQFKYKFYQTLLTDYKLQISPILIKHEIHT